MLEFAELCKGVHPGMFVHSIYVDSNLEADQKAGFVSNPTLSSPNIPLAVMANYDDDGWHMDVEPYNLVWELVESSRDCP